MIKQLCNVLLCAVVSSSSSQSAEAVFPKWDASTLPIAAKIHIGGNPDWLAVGLGAVWVSVPRINQLVQIDPWRDEVRARIATDQDPCYGIGVGPSSLWLLNCQSNTLIRINPRTRKIDLRVPVTISPDGEGTIAVTRDHVWFVGNDDGHSGTLVEVDARSGRILNQIRVGDDSAVVHVAFGAVWVTSSGKGKVYRVDPVRHKVTAIIDVPAGPRFTTVGEGAIWVLSQSDGSVSRIDPATNKVIANIAAKVPGVGGDIFHGGGWIWVSMAGTPVTRIDPKSNKVVDQYGNYKGADAIRFGFHSVWVSDHTKGDLWKIDARKIGALKRAAALEAGK